MPKVIGACVHSGSGVGVAGTVSLDGVRGGGGARARGGGGGEARGEGGGDGCLFFRRDCTRVPVESEGKKGGGGEQATFVAQCYGAGLQPWPSCIITDAT